MRNSQKLVFAVVAVMLTGAAPDIKISTTGQDVKIDSLYNGLVLDIPLTSAYTKSTTVASDRTPYGQHMTATGTPPTIAADGVTFNGSNDVLTYTVSGFRSSDTSGSISAWFKTDPGDLCVILASHDTPTNNYAMLFSYHPGISELGSFFVYLRSAALAPNIAQLYSTTTGLDDSAWHHVVFANNGTSLKMYIDGTEDTVVEGTPGNNDGRWFGDIINRDSVTVGASIKASSAYGLGTVAHLKVYNRELTSIEAAKLYAIGRRTLSTKVSP